MKYCSNCGKEMEDKEKVCTACGTGGKKMKKPIYKKWWFWAVIVIAAVIGITGGSQDAPAASDTAPDAQQQTEAQAITEEPTQEQIVYEVIALQQMIDDLDANAMKAEKTYQDKYVEVSGKITNFDSDGAYISIEPENEDVWNFTSVTCRINGEAQEAFLMEKAVGDVVTIRGQVVTIGELMGYTIEMDEVF